MLVLLSEYKLVWKLALQLVLLLVQKLAYGLGVTLVYLWAFGWEDIAESQMLEQERHPCT
jgi:hypothetical protein